MQEIAMTARCRECKKLFAGPSIVVLGSGMGQVNARIRQFLGKLTSHMANTHPEISTGIAIAAMEYQGMMILSKFETESDALKMQLDVARWNIHQKTLLKRISDDEIRHAVSLIVPELLTLAAANDPATITRNLEQWVMGMRNVLEEPGKYTFTPFGTPQETEKLVTH